MSRGLVQVVWDRDLDRKSEILTKLWFYNPREEFKNHLVLTSAIKITVTHVQNHIGSGFGSGLTLIGKSWKTHPVIYPKFKFSGELHRPISGEPIQYFFEISISRA